MRKATTNRKYEKAEATFNTSDENDMILYQYILDQSLIIGKSNYLKQLVYQDMQRSRK